MRIYFLIAVLIASAQPADADYYAQLNIHDKVVRVIVADRRFIDSGKVGDNALWVKTCYDRSCRGRYAGIGYKYDRLRDRFISPQPFPSWKLDKQDEWQAPTPRPSFFHRWNEDTKEWNLP